MLTLLLDYNGVLCDPYTDKPITGSQVAVLQLSQQYHIKVVSFGPLLQPLAEFISEHFSCIDESDIIITWNKGSVPGDIAIDDDYFNLYDSKCAIKILFGGDTDTDCVCMNTWEEVLEYLT